MATYAAYRHIELDKVGAGKKRVLKPPGGGSHDLFGEPDKQEKPIVSATRRLSSQSSINLSDEVDAPPANGYSSNAKRGSCNERLFGPVAEPAAAEAKTNGHVATNGKEESATDGATLNGKSEPAIANGGTMNGHTNGHGAAAPAQKPAGRQRVPPGGYSSGLW